MIPDTTTTSGLLTVKKGGNFKRLIRPEQIYMSSVLDPLTIHLHGCSINTGSRPSSAKTFKNNNLCIIFVV
jgi:hypothetical protein